MPEFNAPLRDMRFVLHEVFEAPALWARLPALADHVDADTADAILEEAAKVTGQLIAPLNRSGDEQGAQWHAGKVTTPEGFKAAYHTYMEENQFDWQTAKPYLILSVLNVLGLGFAVWRLFYGPRDEIFTVIVSVLWVIYNLLIIGAAVAVAAEVRQVRNTHRVLARLPGAVKLADGHSYPCELVDYSDGGVGLQLSQALQLPVGSPVSLILQRGNREFVFTGTLTRANERFIGLSFAQLPAEEKIAFVQCTFGRADAWLDHNSGFEADKPIQSLKEILALGIKGYYRLYEYLPAWIRVLAKPFLHIFQWLGSFLPRMPTSTPLTSRPVSRS